MRKNLLFIGLAAAAAYAIFYFRRLKNFTETVKVNFVTIRTKKGTGLNLPTVELIFSLQNITSLPVKILGLNGDFYLNDRYIANLSELQEINVPAFSEVTFPVKVQTNVFDIIQNIDLITKKQSGYTAKANLNINISNNIIPFTIERKF